MEETKKKGWRWGVNRWFVLLFIVLGYFAARAYPPIQPHVQLPAERLSHTPLFTLPVIGEFYLTNTLVALLLVDLIVILIALAVRRGASRGTLVLSGMAAAVEALLEAIYNITETTAGKRARQIFPWFATITLMVLVANWMELIPGVDSIGWLEHSEHGYAVKELFGNVATIVKSEAEHGEGGFVVVPFVRVVSTDLNFTVALALLSVFFTQIIGIKALGGHYFSKFWNTKTLFSKPIFGVIDFAVGLLEIISEISKILSFSFRLFGNIFAGSVLLFVIGSLVPVFAQSAFLLLEFFVGLIQAIVFGMLTMTFMAQAAQGHGEHHEEAHA
ncbi:MAG: F0F1 ATP synthase subunit A [Anaerolineae bacterium]|nr:MAG: F0F1 ATP synthase subunit A [Anaerolineae bacterium]